jgi:hypothetical protein
MNDRSEPIEMSDEVKLAQEVPKVVSPGLRVQALSLAIDAYRGQPVGRVVSAANVFATYLISGEVPREGSQQK